MVKTSLAGFWKKVLSMRVEMFHLLVRKEFSNQLFYPKYP